MVEVQYRFLLGRPEDYDDVCCLQICTDDTRMGLHAIIRQGRGLRWREEQPHLQRIDQALSKAASGVGENKKGFTAEDPYT